MDARPSDAGRGPPSAGAAPGLDCDRRAHHLVRPRGERAVAGALAGAREPVVGEGGAREQPLGSLVEAVGLRALPLGRGDTARHQPRAPVAARPARSNPTLRRDDTRAGRQSPASGCGAGPAAVPRPDGPSLLRKRPEACAPGRAATSAGPVSATQRPPAPTHRRVRRAPGRAGTARAVHDARHPSGCRGPIPSGPRARQIPAR